MNLYANEQRKVSLIIGLRQYCSPLGLLTPNAERILSMGGFPSLRRLDGFYLYDSAVIRGTRNSQVTFGFGFAPSFTLVLGWKCMYF